MPEQAAQATEYPEQTGRMPDDVGWFESWQLGRVAGRAGRLVDGLSHQGTLVVRTLAVRSTMNAMHIDLAEFSGESAITTTAIEVSRVDDVAVFVEATRTWQNSAGKKSTESYRADRRPKDNELHLSEVLRAMRMAVRLQRRAGVESQQRP